MDEPSLRSFCKRLQIELEDNSNHSWITGKCPLAFKTHEKGHDNNPSFGITINKKGQSHFKCFTCGHKGSFSKLVFLLGQARGIDYKKIVHDVELSEVGSKLIIEIPEWDEVNKNGRKQSEENYIQKEEEYRTRYVRAIGHPYLTKRGIGWKTTWKLNIRFDRFQNRVLFPVYDKGGRFRGCTGRFCGKDSYITKRNPKIRDYSGLPKRELLLGEHFCGKRAKHRKGDFLILVEGLFDYARLHEAGYSNVLAILGSEITKEKYDTLVNFDKPIVWFTDNDEAGIRILRGVVNPETGKRDKESGILYKLYGIVPQKIVKYPAGIKDPGECSITQIYQMISSAKLFIK